MKSEVAKTEKSEYPKLMVVENGLNAGTVVLFTEHKEGTVVHGEGSHWVGFQSLKWSMDDFESFEGKVILSND